MDAQRQNQARGPFHHNQGRPQRNTLKQTVSCALIVSLIGGYFGVDCSCRAMR